MFHLAAETRQRDAVRSSGAVSNRASAVPPSSSSSLSSLISSPPSCFYSFLTSLASADTRLQQFFSFYCCSHSFAAVRPSHIPPCNLACFLLNSLSSWHSISASFPVRPISHHIHLPLFINFFYQLSEYHIYTPTTHFLLCSDGYLSALCWSPLFMLHRVFGRHRTAGKTMGGPYQHTNTHREQLAGSCVWVLAGCLPCFALSVFISAHTHVPGLTTIMMTTSS